jgi:HEAT repeat protein
MPLIRTTRDKVAEGAAPGSPSDAARALGSASADERWAAARAEVPAPVPALALALATETDQRVREAIFTALARIATPESVAAVLPYLRSDDANTRTGALDALRAMPSAVRQYLPQLLIDPDADVRLLACDLVRDAGDRDGASWLCALLDTEPQANVCGAAVEVLGQIADETALPALSRCAARFPEDPFLGFAIKVVADRLRAGSLRPGG